MSESVQNVINQNINEATNRPTLLEKEPLPVVNEENRVTKSNNQDKRNIEKTSTSNMVPSELMSGINKLTRNNIELDVSKLPKAKAKLEGNTITLDKKKGRLEDIIYETTHYAENNSKGYEVLSNHILTELEKSGELNTIKDELRPLYQKQYKKENRVFTEEDLNSEVVAKYTERFINDEIFVNKIANADKTLTERIYNWIKDKINYYKKIAKMEPEQKLEYDNLRKTEKLWERALKGANEQSNNIKYHYSENLSTDIDNILNNIKVRTPVKLRDYTPTVLINNGIKDLPMYENPSHIRKNILTAIEAQKLGLTINPRDHYHGLGKDIYIKAIDSLDNPRVIFQKNNSNEYLILTIVKDKNNNNIVVPIEIETTTNVNNIKIDINRIKTVYGYEKINGIDLNDYIKHNIKSSKFTKIYEQKKEKGTDFSTVANSNNSIPQKSNTVNTNSMQKTKKNALSTSKNNKAPKYSIDNNQEQNISNYSSMDNKGRKLTKEQQEFFRDSKVRDESGTLITMYHGTQRADRVGTVFDPNRATSGPMAFFTDNYDIAQNYSTEKGDTSLSREYDTEYDLFKVNGQNLDTFWNSLDRSKQSKIIEKANNIGFADDYETIMYGEKASENSFGNQFNWRLKNEYNGNALKSLYSIWIEDGNLIGEDISKFKNVLELAGIEKVDYLDPYKTDSKVYETYLNVKKTFYTSNMPKSIINQFRENSKKATVGEQYSADVWDKTNITPESWINKLNEDIENGTTYAWTIIPDWVTDVLKSNGYDGIIDTGGKQGGTEHQVVIPFYSNQIKNIDNITPTYNSDIRYSLDDEKTTPPNKKKNERKFYESVKKSPVIAKEIKEELTPKTYRKLTNDESMVTAISKLNRNSNEEVLWFTRNTNETSSVDVAEGLALLSKYQILCKKYSKFLPLTLDKINLCDILLMY